jgi:hypothetical protein
LIASADICGSPSSPAGCPAWNTCPVYLLAGEADDITSREQVFNAENLLGTSKNKIEKKLVPGGHISACSWAADVAGGLAGDRPLDRCGMKPARWISLSLIATHDLKRSRIFFAALPLVSYWPLSTFAATQRYFRSWRTSGHCSHIVDL